VVVVVVVAVVVPEAADSPQPGEARDVEHGRRWSMRFGRAFALPLPPVAQGSGRPYGNLGDHAPG
nr:hypothetical protein [Planctomycetota bacterium]